LDALDGAAAAPDRPAVFRAVPGVEGVERIPRDGNPARGKTGVGRPVARLGTGDACGG